MDRSSKMASKLKVNRNLPIEIESNILSRLPVKTLVRFRSVQKSWYSLISDSYFVNLHRLQNQMDNLLVIQKDGDGIVVADTCSNEHSLFEKPYPHTYNYNVVDSCNGLVCVYGQSHKNISGDGEYDMACISLWNPALRISKMIRQKQMSMKRYDLNFCVGFGFHNQTNDYKVISFINDINTSRIKEVEIYSLSSDSWRKVNGPADSLNNYLSCEPFGVYVSDAALIPSFHGAYCWLAEVYVEQDDHEEDRIISFDMGDEVFKEIMLPHTVSQVNSANHDLSLFNYKDSLGMLEIVEDTTIVDSTLCYVWVMKEYREVKSWTKLYKFEQCPLYVIKLLGVALETELVLMMDDFGRNEVHVLDFDKLEINTSSTKDISILRSAWRVISFRESLVLLNSNY